jgi:radical SAM protein with 4Fe4S-binding SPASM domain
VEVGLELLPYCNLRCFHCYSDSGPDQSHTGLSLEKIKALCDELADLQVFKINLLGGEPFARRDITEIIQLAAQRSLAVTITTNGTLLNEWRLEALREAPPALIQVSLDGACAETNDAIRGTGSFDKAVRGLGLLMSAGVRTAIGTVACQRNYREIPNILRLTLELGVKNFHLMGVQPGGRGIAQFEDQRLTDEQWVVLYEFFSERAAKLCEQIGFQIEIDKLVLFKHGLLTPQNHLDEFVRMCSTCPCSRSMCTITANGDVLACGLMRNVVAGNILQQSLREIWNGSEVFRAIRQRSLGIAACSGCPFWNSCLGGCAAVTYNLAGNFTGADPRCELAK